MELKDEIRKVFATEPLKYAIVGFIGFLTTLAVSVWKTLKGTTEVEIPSWILIIGNVLFFALAVTFFTFWRRTRSRVGISEAELEAARADWKLLSIEMFYRYLGENKYRMELRITGEAQCDGVERYLQKSIWTGNGPRPKVSVRNRHLKLTELEHPDSGRMYEIRLPAPVRKGHIEEIEIDMDLSDSKETAKPFISCTVVQPTDRIQLRVGFSDNIRPEARAVLLEYATALSATPSSHRDIGLEMGEFRWEIAEPMLHHRYVINWSNEDQL